MKYILVILFFILYIDVYCQSIVRPLPEYANMTYEEITTMFPDYYTLTGRWGWGRIVYQNTLLPGNLYFSFSRNRCYALQYIYWSTDSLEARAVYDQYLGYLKDTLHVYIMNNWGENEIYKHHFWEGRGGVGWGAVMYDASRIYYNHISWDGRYYLVWFSMFNKQHVFINSIPYTKPRIQLQ